MGRMLHCGRSMSFQDQPVELCADTKYHSADNLNYFQRVCVYGAVTNRTGSQEQAIFLFVQRELDRIPVQHRGGAGLRERSTERQLPGARGPDDGINLAFDDPVGISLERDLSLVARLD